MNNEFKEIFDSVKAEESLKNSTKVFLAEKIRSYTKTKTPKRKIFLCAAACACMLLLVGTGGLYFTPTSEISIDINPSLVMSINRFDRVISMNGLNEDGKELTGELDVKFKKYVDAVNLILENEKISALLSNDDIMTITVTGTDEEQTVRIFSNVEECTSGHENAHCYYASSDETEAAHNAGLSCGKYKLFQQAKALDPYITPEMIQSMTVKEIHELIDALLSENSVETSSGILNGHHGSNGHGHG